MHQRLAASGFVNHELDFACRTPTTERVTSDPTGVQRQCTGTKPKGGRPLRTMNGHVCVKAMMMINYYMLNGGYDIDGHEYTTRCEMR